MGATHDVRARLARGAGARGAVLALAAQAEAAPPHPALPPPGAFCTRPGCAGAERSVGSSVAGFSLATLASIGLGRARRRGSPPA